jgi:hypothetical protein
MEFLIGFFGGLLRVFAGLLNWQFKTKTPFEPEKFFQSLVSAAITGAIFQFTLSVDFSTQSLLLGWGASEAINKGISIAGLGDLATNFVRNTISALKGR